MRSGGQRVVLTVWKYITSDMESAPLRTWEGASSAGRLFQGEPGGRPEGDASPKGGWTERGPGLGGRAQGRRAQGEVHYQAEGVLGAQDLQDAGLGQPEVRELESGSGLGPENLTRRSKGSAAVIGQAVAPWSDRIFFATALGNSTKTKWLLW